MKKITSVLKIKETTQEELRLTNIVLDVIKKLHIKKKDKRYPNYLWTMNKTFVG